MPKPTPQRFPSDAPERGDHPARPSRDNSSARPASPAPRDRDAPPRDDRPARAARAKWLLAVIWSVIGILVLLGALGYALGSILPAIALIIVSSLIILILRTPVAAFERRGIPRWAGTLIAYAIMFLVIAVLILVFIPLIWQQLLGLVSLVPSYTNEAGRWWNDFYPQYSYLLEETAVQQAITSVGGGLSSWAVDLVTKASTSVITIGTSMIAGVIGVFVSLIVSFWVLKDLPRIGREVRIIVGPRFEEDVIFVSSTLARSVTGYLRGILIQGTCSGILSGICFSVLGMPYPVVLGLLVGLMNFIPIIGPWIAAITCGLIGLFISPLTGLLAILTILVSQQLVDNFITPRVMSSVVELHPAIVLIGIFTGGVLGGVFGLIAAVPLLATAKAVFVYYFERRTGRALASEKGALFRINSPRRPKNEDQREKTTAGFSASAEPAAAEPSAPAEPASAGAPADRPPSAEKEEQE